VLQKLYGLLIAHYTVRAVIYDAALQAHIDPDRISFVRAASLIKDAVHDFQLVTPRQHSRLYRRLLRDLAQNLLPPRALRPNPRVVKRKMSNFKLRHPAHPGVPALQRLFADTCRSWPQPHHAEPSLDPLPSLN
jgi:hypothetical protein